MTEQNALVWEGGQVVKVRPVPVPESRPGWVAVDIAYAGICGSDLHVAAGEHIRAQPGTILGHEFVGHLAEPYGDLPVGHPVFVNPMVHCGVCEACLAGRTNVCHTLTAVGVDYPGAIAPRTVVPDYGIYPLPEDVDLVAAALIEPVAVAVRAVRRSGLALGDRAHVIGGGPVGCLVGLLSTAAGATVTVSEPSEVRRKYAADLGLRIVEHPADLDPGADVVFDASGHTSVAAELLRWLRTQGTAVIVGAYSPGLHGVDLLSVMFAEITMIGTRIYQRSDIEAAIELVTAGKLDAHRLISKIFPLDDAVDAIESLRRGEGMKVLIDPTPAQAM
jgi:(R,R)-butanediol dehydrogenase / meso-butanediol dehydrogenase / diacetyl reductase